MGAGRLPRQAYFIKRGQVHALVLEPADEGVPPAADARSDAPAAASDGADADRPMTIVGAFTDGAELLLHQAFSQTTAPVRMTANIHTEVRHDTRGCHTNAKLLLPVLRPTA